MGKYLSSVLALVGQVVDAAIPVANGSRTAISALIGLATTAAPIVLPLIPAPYSAALVALVPVIQQLVAIATPLFAVAHVVRPAAPAPAAATS